MGVDTQQLLMFGVELTDEKAQFMKNQMIGDDIKKVDGYGTPDFDLDYEVNEIFYDSGRDHSWRKRSGNKEIKMVSGMDGDYKLGIILSESDEYGSIDTKSFSPKKLKKLRKRAFKQIREHTQDVVWGDIKLIVFCNYT